MSNQFLKLRRSAVPGRVPSTSSIDFGEIALNTYDGLAFIKRSGSLGEEVITLGSREGAFTGSFSGSFIGNGGGLFNISASAIVGLNLSQIATGSVSASVGVGASSFSVVSGSNTFLYVSSSGNAGIGTTSPTAKIHISGSGTDSLLRIQSSFEFNGAIQTNIVNVNGRGEVGIGATPLNQIPLYVYRSGYGELLRLGSDANTIGFSNGEIYLASATVAKFSQLELRMSNNSGNVIIRNSYGGPSSGISLIAPANIILTPGTFDGSGNVGINTTSPTAKLDVSGSSRFIGNMTVTGSSYFLGPSDNVAFTIRSGTASSAYLLADIQMSGGASAFTIANNGAINAYSSITYGGQTIVNADGIIFRNATPVEIGRISQTNSETGGATNGYTSNQSRKFTFSHGIYASGGNTILGPLFADLGDRLQVTGSSRFIGNMVISGSGNTNATNALTVVSNNGTGSLIVRNDGQIQVRSTGAGNPGYSFIDNTDTGLYMIGTGMYNVVDSVITVAYGSNGIAFNASGSTNSETSANLQLTKTGVGHRLSVWLNNNNDFHFEAWENSVGYANNIILNGYGGAVILGATTSTGEKLQVTGTTSLKGNAVVTGSLTVTGTLTAQTIVAQTITSSTEYVSGSTIFGNSLSNTHQFTGSVSITGSLNVNGGSVPLGSGAMGQITYWNSASNITGSNNLIYTGSYINLLYTGGALGQNTFIGGLNFANQDYIEQTFTYSQTNSNLLFQKVLATVKNTWLYNDFNGNTGIGIIGKSFTAFGDTIKFRKTNIVGGISAVLNISLGGGNNTPVIISAEKEYYAYNHSLILNGTNTGVVNSDQLVVASSGNVIINSSADSGNRLQVYGTTFLSGSVTGSDMLIRGSGNTSGTSAFQAKNSSGTNLFTVVNDGYVYSGYITYIGQSSTNPLTFAFDGSAFTSPNTSGRNYGYFNSNTNQTGDQYHFGLSGNNLSPTSGNHVGLYSARTFAPTSGTATYFGLQLSQTINQTGGANGITRGLYVNPTLTSTADFRAIEWSNNASGSTSWGLYGSGSAPNYLSGSLSIGTTSSLAPLHVFSTGNQTAYFASTNAYIRLYSSQANRHATIEQFGETAGFGSQGTRVIIGTLYSNGVSVAAANQLNISSNLVGIGTLAQTAKVHIVSTGSGSASTALLVQNSAASNLLSVLDNGNTFISGTLDILDAEINYQRNNNVTTGSARLIASIPTASLNAAFFDYVIVSGSNARAGTVMSVWASSSVEWNETYTNDIGSTTDVSLYAAITGSSIGLFATSSINNIWTIKSLIRTI